MKNRYDLTIDNTQQISGGFLETTESMTEKQMIAYVRKACRQFLLNNKEIKKYGIWAEIADSDEYSFHIEASRNPGGYIDIMVYDADKCEIIVDTYHDRLERNRKKDEEESRKFWESYNAICK